MHDIRDPDGGMPATDAEFIDMVAAAAAAGHWDPAWLPRLVRLARQGAALPGLPGSTLGRIFDDRFSWSRG